MNKNLFIIKLIVVTVLLCTYIIPVSMLSSLYVNVSKLFFIIIIFFTYILKIQRVTLNEFIFFILILIFTFITKNINYLSFISLLLLPKIINNDGKKYIKEFLGKSRILYVCLIFTILYSFVYFGLNNRYAYTGLNAPNQSGLAIFCLGMLLMMKNKKVGYFTLGLGLFTLSRSYFLSLVICILNKFKIFSKFNRKMMKKFSYFKLTMISTFLLLVISLFFVYQYRLGNIVSNSNSSSRLFNFLDYSNFFRFTAILIVLNIFKTNLFNVIFGMSEDFYIKCGYEVSQQLKIPYHYIVPHNLFLAHLKLYGIFSIAEVIYTSKILLKLVNKNNFYLYIIILFYSIILGAGLYSYWLYLSVFVFILYEDSGNLRGEICGK